MNQKIVMPRVMKRKLGTLLRAGERILGCFENFNWWRLQVGKDSVVLISCSSPIPRYQQGPHDAWL